MPFRAFGMNSSTRPEAHKTHTKSIAASGFFQGLILPLISITCRWCNVTVCVCRSCWQGQAYCSDECRNAGHQASRREAQRRYRQTEKGRRAHRLAENRRRQRKNQGILKNMDDTPSTPVVPRHMLVLKYVKNVSFQPGADGYCHFCGRQGVILIEFPCRGYGKRVQEAFF